ncbi:hypothetical protein [Poritiphilus flavus]|uniref:Uncharacterized protein n=1 Tax=Poritiphilus flavus TaxID=2697053 RepID=A0A6L9EE11_9FLAO|nr:hypothetical protein [Poritiphilus flavus]NAS12808.1 hypothetical protein [Poritiphilus flavus]
MIKILRYTEYLYLGVFLVCLYEIATKWNTDREGTYIFIFFGLASLGMFLFRRRYRKRFEKRKKENQN